MSNSKYSETQIDFLRANLNNNSLTELTELFNSTFSTFCSELAIKNTLSRYKIKRPKRPAICEELLIGFFQSNLNCTIDELTRRYNKEFGCNLCSASVRIKRRKAIGKAEVGEETVLSFTEYNNNIDPHIHELATTSWGVLLSKSHKRIDAA